MKKNVSNKGANVGHTEIVCVVRCVRCKAEKDVRAGGDPMDTPWCDKCQMPMCAVRAVTRRVGRA